MSKRKKPVEPPAPAPRVVPPMSPEILERYGPVDPRPGRFYVSAVDGDRVWALLGPLPNHELALRMIRPVREMGVKGNPWAAFYSFGSFRIKDDEPDAKPGSANKYFPEAFEEGHAIAA